MMPVPSVAEPVNPSLTLHLPPLPDIDFSRLEGDEFIPPGATVIWPDPKVSVALHLTSKGKYPSTSESVARDGNAVVGSRSEQLTDHLRHWLRLYRRGDEQARNIFHTEHSFETLWSQDSRGIAISHFLGKNHAEVLVVRLRNRDETKHVETRDALVRYFSEAQLESPRFEKAYRWSDGPLLVVRGIGRQSSAPHDLFGYEMVVDSEHLDDPSRMRLIRGYTKASTVK